MAALHGIDNSYFEAAEMDGASFMQKIRYIVYPLCKPTTLFLLVTSVIGSFQVFMNAYMMTGGGPDNNTTMIGLLIFNNAFVYAKYGLACAQAIMLSIVIAALTVVQFKVMGNDVAVGMAASQGNFELNVFMPVCIDSFLQSVRLLADGMRSFNKHCAAGIRANREKMRENLNRSLMLVTALNPYIGYENAARVAKLAHAEGLSLREACLRLGFLSAEEFDRVFHPEKMV